MISVPDKIAASKRYPAMTRMDDDTEFISSRVNERGKAQAVSLKIMKRDKSSRKAFIDYLSGYVSQKHSIFVGSGRYMSYGEFINC